MSIDIGLWWNLVKIILVLLIIAPLIYFITKWYSQFASLNTTIKIKERVFLSGGKSLYVVEWGINKYLLAVTPRNIEVIGKEPLPAANLDIACGKVGNNDSQ